MAAAKIVLPLRWARPRPAGYLWLAGCSGNRCSSLECPGLHALIKAFSLRYAGVAGGQLPACGIRGGVVVVRGTRRIPVLNPTCVARNGQACGHTGTSGCETTRTHTRTWIYMQYLRSRSHNTRPHADTRPVFTRMHACTHEHACMQTHAHMLISISGQGRTMCQAGQGSDE